MPSTWFASYGERARRTGGLDAALGVAGDDVIWQPYLTDGARAARVGTSCARRSPRSPPRASSSTRRSRTSRSTAPRCSRPGRCACGATARSRKTARCWAFHFRGGRLRRQTSFATRDEALETVAALGALNDGPFRIAEEGEGEDRVVRLAGELDVATAARWMESVLLRPRAPRERRRKLDLAELGFMDSTGPARAAAGAPDRPPTASGASPGRRVPPNIRRLFELAGVHEAMPSEPEDPRAEVGD